MEGSVGNQLEWQLVIEEPKGKIGEVEHLTGVEDIVQVITKLIITLG